MGGVELEWWRVIFEQVEDAIFVKDDAGRYELINPAGVRMLGCDSVDQVVGKTDAELFGPDAAHEIGAIDREILDSGASRTYERTRMVGGVERVLFTTKVPFVDPATGTRYLIGIGRDVTERSRLREQLSTSARLATIGALYGGVAHEVNNPLTAVMGGLELLGEQLGETAMPDGARGELAETLSFAERGVDRIRTIIRDLAILARPVREDARPVDLEALLDSALQTAASELRYRVRVVRDYAGGEVIQARPQLLSQMFLQLLVLAARALPEGHVDEYRLDIRTRRRDGHVDVEIETTGDGLLPRDDRDDAAFAVARFAAARHRGTLELQRGTGGGNAVVVSLPTAAEDQPVPAAGAAATDDAPGPLRLMVVDDEPDLRALIIRMLGDDHDYVQAGSGDEAIELLERDSRVDAILCDLMMASGTGMELYDWLTRNQPGLIERIIFVTGGAFTERGRAFLDDVRCPVVEKPFSRDQLETALARVRAAS